MEALNRAFKGRGSVTVQEALLALYLREVVRQWPEGPLPNVSMQLREGTRVSDVVRWVETEAGWIYEAQSKSFYPAVATHAIDSPDAFGRPTNVDQRAPLERRGLVTFAYRFVKLNLGTAGRADLGFGAELDRQCVSVPEGVHKSFDDTESRSYFEGVTAGLTATSVATTRQTVQAGIQLEVLAARLPGNGFRTTGTLSVSSFTDSSLGTAQVQIPFEMDGERGRWYRVYTSEGASANASLALRRFGAKLSLAGDAVALEIKVD
jgi:hypothetical protein